MRAAIYARVSTEEQREKQTIVNQKDFGERFCALHEIPIYDVYLDDGVTGTLSLDRRPEGQRLLADAAQERFDILLIYRLDRLGRDPRLILNSVNDLESMGVKVRSMTEPFDTSEPSGRFLLTIMAGVAGLERDTFLARSAEGSHRLAREGVWLGGIVPFGYRKEGTDRGSRLVIADELLPGTSLSEAEVVRLIFRLTVEEHKSCMAISDYLNLLGVPPSYAKDGRRVAKGKRKEATAGIWRPGRIRAMLVNSTYYGVHEYGRTSKRLKEPIRREVPAIVDKATWARAQEVLKEHRLLKTGPTGRKYLLRGLIKCGLCGLTYSGMGWRGKGAALHTYYRCNGAQAYRGIYGNTGQKCPSASVNGDIEDQVWADIESFARNPGPILEELEDRQHNETESGSVVVGQIEQLKRSLATKTEERDRVIGLFRRKRIRGDELDRQLDQLDAEEASIKAELAELERQGESVRATAEQLRSASEFLEELRANLDKPLTWEFKRKCVETIVKGIRVDTVPADGKSKKHAVVTVSYRFGQPHDITSAINHTDSSQVTCRSATDRRRFDGLCTRRHARTGGCTRRPGRRDHRKNLQGHDPVLPAAGRGERLANGQLRFLQGNGGEAGSQADLL